MVVYRNGRPSPERSGSSHIRKRRLRALLIGGFGAGLIATGAQAQQQAAPAETLEKTWTELTRAERRALRKIRREHLLSDPDRLRNKRIAASQRSSSAKSDDLAATLSFSDENPLLSSIDVLIRSKPAFADIDGDGDLDAFVGEYLGSVVYYENVGLTPDAPDFNSPPVYDPFGISVGYYYSAPAFADIDDDGDLDLFVGQGSVFFSEPGVLYFCENTEFDGTATNSPGFTCGVNPFGIPNVPDAYSYPAFADLDADGDLDALIGDGVNEPVHYENTWIDGTNVGAGPTFTTAQAFGFASVPYDATPAFVDVDGDGDFDVFLGADDGDLRFYENTGSSTLAVFASTPSTNPFGFTNVGNNSAPAFADIDDQGDLDAAVGTYGGVVTYFENEDPTSGASQDAQTFTPRPLSPFGLAGVDQLAAPTFGDLDKDGDLDALIGTSDGSLVYFKNEGSPSTALFSSAGVTNPFGLTDKGANVSPVFVDLDSDGDLDVLVGEGFNVYLFENTWIEGTVTGAGPTFVEVTDANPFGLAGFGTGNDAPAFIDIDGDCDLDHFVGNGTSSVLGIGFQENTGDPWNPAFASHVSNPFGLTNLPDRMTPSFVDVDGDGDPDLISGSDVGELIYFENTGSAASPAFASAITNPSELRLLGTFTRPAFADIDDDGKADILAGDRTGRISYFRNLTVPDGATPVRLAVRTFLQGPYSTSNDMMSTALNSEIPLNQPYDGADFTGTPLEHSGSETLTSVPPEMVDWILLQLRTGDPPDPQSAVTTQAVVLRSDGTVADTEGLCPAFDIASGEYWIVVFHRNHLGVMTSQKIPLSSLGPATYNLTDASARAFGSSPMDMLEAGVFGLFGGDSGADGQVTASDFNEWLADTKAVATGYLVSDFTLDGQVIASDFNLWLTNTKAVATSKVPGLP